ncbi:MAG: GGDEF domain-containing protein [Treponema sp.]|nr:GGDEF domain-containing protein [Treponema sp.]
MSLLRQILINCRADFFCLLLITIIYIDSIRASGKFTEVTLLRYFMISVFIYIFSYSAHLLFQKQILTGSLFTSRILLLLKNIFQCHLAYCWFIFSEYSVTNKKLQPCEKAVWIMPDIFNAICVFITIFQTNGFLYTANADGSFSRGPLFFLQYVFLVPYLFSASIPNLLKSFKPEYYVKQSILRTYAFFPVFPILTILFQFFVPGYFSVGIGILLSLILVYVNILRHTISHDYLTKINNRQNLIEFLTDRIKTTDKDMYLLMMDVNKFKSINDNHGHEEGDKALIHIAECLKAVAERIPCFISRYGGDEFIIVFETNNIQDVSILCEEIHSELKVIVSKYNLPYELSVAIGYAQSSGVNQDIDQLIAEADKKLYINKNNAN